MPVLIQYMWSVPGASGWCTATNMELRSKNRRGGTAWYLRAVRTHNKPFRRVVARGEVYTGHCASRPVSVRVVGGT